MMQAEEQVLKELGDYNLHHNVFNTSALTAEVAKKYGIKRSKKQGMIIVSALKKELGFNPVEIVLAGSATNFNQQLRSLSFREIKEGKAIYYIAVFPIENNETLRFDLEVLISDEEKNTKHNVTFQHAFYTE